MKPLLTLIFLLLFLLSCAPGNTVRLTQARLQEPGGTTQPLDTLAAYRKHPGQPKSVHVKEYTRQDGTVVRGHDRSERTTH